MRVLRPHLESAEAFAEWVDEVQRPEGYRLVAAGAAGGDVEAVAGFRVVTMLHAGRHVYVDDLSTLPEARGRGRARALLTWIEEEARRLGCEQLHLDSGVGPERAAAHRLYHAFGMRIASHHFAKRVEPSGS